MYYQPIFVNQPRTFANGRISVNICVDEYETCETYSHKRWSNIKNGKYGEGLINSPDDERRVERTGLLGEMAFGKVFNLPIDLTYREYGDDKDFDLNGLSVNVKTASRYPWYQRGLIRSGKYFEIKSDIYVFAYIKEENRAQKKADIVIVGFAEKDYVLTLPLSPARRGNHINREVPYREMKPITKLFSKGRKSNGNKTESHVADGLC